MSGVGFGAMIDLDFFFLIGHDENSMFSQVTSKDRDDSSCARTTFDEQSHLYAQVYPVLIIVPTV